ncbi:M64 family metallopeptidase [Capnocytophaga gingivalis]
MKKMIILVALLLTVLVQAQSYDAYFTKEALRLDFYLYGTKNTTHVSLKGMKKEPLFAGSHTHLIHPNQGEYRVQVLEIGSGKVLFSKGMVTLMEEWQGMEADATKTEFFEIPCQTPFPKGVVEVTFEIRTKEGNFQKIFTTKVDPSDYRIVKEAPVKYPIKSILQNGSPQKKVDIAVIPEGYTQEQMEKFIADVKRLFNYLFATPPYNKHKKDFNIQAILAPSQESGTDMEGSSTTYKNTLLDSHFYSFGMDRYLTCPSLFKAADVAAAVPYDQLFVVVNTKEYGGGAFYNVINLNVSDNKYAEKTFVHEFGHGFVGLADEYYSEGEEGMADRYNLKIEPWEANITTLVNFQSKWKDLVEKQTPIPTPRTEQYKNKVGAFEGGGYLFKGMYSPMEDCRMKSIQSNEFCPVCSRAIERMIQFYTE